MASRWRGEWVSIKQFGDTDFIKVKILSNFKELGVIYYKCATESGHIFSVPVDSIQCIGENKKAKIIHIKTKPRLVK